jgi:hypothetical protein
MKSAPTRQVVLAALVLAHLLSGGAAVIMTYNRAEIQQALPFGITIGGSSLLGVWFGLGASRIHIRLAAAAIGICYTSLLFMLSRGHNGINLQLWVQSGVLMSSVATAIAGPLLFFRRKHVDLSLVEAGQFSCQQEAFQFSLRHLSMLILVFGLLCWAARASHAALASAALGQAMHTLIFIADFSLGFAATAGVILWMALGKGNPIYRCPVAILAAGANGLLLAYCFDRTSLESLMAWAAVAALNGICIAASLLVVRCCGYRLVRRIAAPTPSACVEV